MSLSSPCRMMTSLHRHKKRGADIAGMSRGIVIAIESPLARYIPFPPSSFSYMRERS